MDSKLNILYIIKLLIVIYIASCTPRNIQDNSGFKADERKQLIKDYAFCKCLEYSLERNVSKDVDSLDASKGVLFDVANLGLLVSEVDSFVYMMTNKEPIGQVTDLGNKKPITLNCLLFHRSNELNLFVNSLLK